MQQLLNLCWVDVLSAADDHVLDAPLDLTVAIGIHRGNVTTQRRQRRVGQTITNDWFMFRGGNDISIRSLTYNLKSAYIKCLVMAHNMTYYYLQISTLKDGGSKAIKHLG